MPSYDRKNPKTQRLPIDAARVAAERQPHTNSTPTYPIITARRRDARAKNMNVHFTQPSKGVGILTHKYGLVLWRYPWLHGRCSAPTQRQHMARRQVLTSMRTGITASYPFRMAPSQRNSYDQKENYD
jgi:hypothetical protein